MQTDQLNGLIALKLVAEQKRFSEAAKILHVTPSAVSQTIKQLEQRLGVALLSRTTRSTNLTEAGERFLSQAGPALDQILTAMDTVGTYAARPSGLLRITLPRVAYPTFMGPLVRSFLKTHPEVTVELYFDDELADIVEGGFDAGIRLSEMMARDMVALNMSGPIRFAVMGAPKYLNKVGRPKHPKDLLAYNCVRLRVGENEFYDKWEFETKGKEFQVEVKGTLILNDSALVLNAGIEGSGLIYFPEELAKDKINSGKLEIVLDQYAAISEGFFLYYPKRSQVLPKLRAFIDHIRTDTKEQEKR